jgi:hypothetical protein
MLYELRIYHVYDGKMDKLHGRFFNPSLKMFEKHGMKVVDYWDDYDGKNLFYYILEHKDKKSRERNFEALMKEPEIIEAHRISELDGPVVEKIDSYFMKRIENVY